MFFLALFFAFMFRALLRVYDGSFLEIFLFRPLVAKLKIFITKLRPTRKIMKLFQKCGRPGVSHRWSAENQAREILWIAGLP